MRIAVVVPGEESVPPATYGGTELVAYNLVQQLTAMGHKVTLVASGDSHTNAKLFAPIARSLRASTGDKLLQYREYHHYLYVGKVVGMLANNKFDIIHSHLGWQLLPFTNLLSAPVITTMHGPLNVENQQLFYQPFADANFVSISMNQRKGMPHLNYVATVYNGIDVDKFVVGKGKREYLAFLGRFSPEKGPIHAIQVAKKTGIPLIMAGKVDRVDEDYFKRMVKPHVNGKTVRFIGEVNHPQKLKLLCGAKALLSPVQWEEPFGLVNVEALACGTPVIALRRGSLPELITEGVGFVCDTVDAMVAAVGKLDNINPNDCRRLAEERFSAACMTLGYLAAYKKVINNARSVKGGAVSGSRI